MINFYKKSRFFSASLGIVLFFLFSLGRVLALGPVSFSADTTFSVGSFTLIVLAGSSATEFTVSGSTISVTLGGDDTFTVTSTAHNLLSVTSGPAGHFVCGTNFSSLVVSRSATSIITPSDSTCSPAPAPVINTGSGPPPATTQPQAPPANEPAIKPLEKLFKDVQPADEKYILPLVEFMMGKKTYVVPANKRFGPKVTTRADFGIQIAAAVAKIGCGSDVKFPGAKKCRAYAQEQGLVSRSFPKGILKRIRFYELLLKARGIQLAAASTGDLKAACSDVNSANKKTAGIFLTANKAGIAATYKGGTCKLNTPFTRKEAAEFGWKTYMAF